MKKILIILCVCLSYAVYGRVLDQSGSAPKNELGSKIQQKLPPSNNINAAMESQVNSNLAPKNDNLKNLVDQTPKEADKSLLPVKATVMKLQMMNGNGGKTFVKYSDGKTLVVEDGFHYECNGTINSQAECNGSLSILNIQQKDNYCYINPRGKSNNLVCIGDGNSISLLTVNGKVSCSSHDNSPALLIPQEDYDKKCENKGREQTYTYIADVHSPFHVEIVKDNPFLKCQNSEPNICVFS